MSAARPQAVLLTGATGLVGRFLLRRLLQLGHRVAVLVRRDRTGDSRQRLEAVIKPFEKDQLLGRPRVIEGDLSSDELGVKQSDLEWLSRYSLHILHCAASIRFVRDTGTSEPYATNVRGTEGLLLWCRQLKVASFHHVSTAYVGSRGTSPVLELPIRDCDQAGNDYESSKIQAEQMVLACEHIGDHYVHRPSIVVGDSESGFTSTFHGFYAPLKLGAQFAGIYGFDKQAGNWFRSQLGLNEGDSKNLVPVDWVADCITHVVNQRLARPEPQHAKQSQRIFHWTHDRPVNAQVMQDAIVDALEAKFSTVPSAATPENLTDQFRTQMQAYESYFCGDPQFDRCNASEAVPKACPPVDYDLLRKMATFALESNFGWPKPPMPEVPEYGQQVIQPSENGADSVAPRGELEIRLLGSGAPEPFCVAAGPTGWRPAIELAPHGTVATLPLSSLKDVISGSIDLDSTIDRGRISIRGTNSRDALAIFANWVDEMRERWTF